MYKKISDYGIIGNLCSVALIGLDGSIDWLCWPHIDSPSLFAALLDDERGGHFVISPAEEWDSTADYAPHTNILVTRFRTRSGTLQITDFMPLISGGQMSRQPEQPGLYRLVEVIGGSVQTRMTCKPRFDYAREVPAFEKTDGGAQAKTTNENIVLLCDREVQIGDDCIAAEWNLSQTDKVWFYLGYGHEESARLNKEQAAESLRDTKQFWREWLKKNESGRVIDLGGYQKMVDRSALVLKLLYYNPTGAIAAAATTSLPEQIGGVRNWDYRFTWVRDTSFTVQALFELGHLSETEGYLKWIETLLVKRGAADMQILYGVNGEKGCQEQELSHLDGYKGSRPVRIGNDAANQKQLDIYGELLDAALKLSNYVGKIKPETWPFLRDVCDYVVDHWEDKDSGIWEVRGGPYHFVYSKVMCWVALDRGLTIARRYGFAADFEKWEQTRARIKQQVLEKGWRETSKTFVQHYETEALDAGNLLIPIVGFLPFDDPRIISTIEAIQRELTHDDLVYRYIAEDGLAGSEGSFLFCTFWLIYCLIGLNRCDEAERLLGKATQAANHLGLFSEEYDVEWKEALGNFPQAFTHIGYINCAVALNEAIARKREERPHHHAPILRSGFLAFRRVISGDGIDWRESVSICRSLIVAPKRILNDGEVQDNHLSRKIVVSLKQSMNRLRGAFFDTYRGRVAYEKMKGSEAYRKHVELSRYLKTINLDALESREEQIAFWINLYNVIVMHGVVELGIRDSIKEVVRFLARVQYQIDDMFFSPDDIEHGILRGNRRPPHSPFRVFGKTDKRRKLSIVPVDPRIHFALVCASSSCPPIEVYTAQDLDKELHVAGQSFINGGGVEIDKVNGRVLLSRVFKWYAGDFAATTAERLRSLAPYFYREGDRDYLLKNSARLNEVYQDYDWRLNRY